MRTGCAVIAVSDGQLTIAALVPCFPPRLLAFLFGDGVIEGFETVQPPFFDTKDHRRKHVRIHVLLIERLPCFLMREFPLQPQNAPGVGACFLERRHTVSDFVHALRP